VRIRNFSHKGLKKFYEDDSVKAVPPDTVDKLRKMLAFLDDIEEPDELHALPAWKAHTLTGDRKGTWSLSVTRNRRLTFRIDTGELRPEFGRLPLGAISSTMCGWEFDLPQGLKPYVYYGRSGTAKAVPFQNAFTSPVTGRKEPMPCL
jgi:proteic killer suppression protein